MCLSLSGCSQNPATDPEDITEVQTKVNIEKTQAELLEEHLVDYNHEGIFTMRVPGTWEVSTGGYDMFYWIHIYDPKMKTYRYLL
ncbi:MAG: hypothetical protein Q4B56_06495 [Erysipelotrichaceae bacterium]|nr:hypothetical protein [Erysipelotrichaceae bacterium]